MINYNLELRNYLFGTITEDMLVDYVKTIKNIPHGEVNKEIKDTYKKFKNILQTQHNMNINISPKVDSFTQRRVQCSIPKLNTILDLFPQNIISRTTEPIIRNIQISASIYSGPRIRIKKLKL